MLSRALSPRTCTNSPSGQGINAAARYCRTPPSNLGAGGLSWLCDTVANVVRRLVAPNGRCLFVGVHMDLFVGVYMDLRGVHPSVFYTTIFCS